jgi:hypothetical protein
MINHHIHAALAHERASTFLAEAEAARQAKQVRARWRRRPARPQPEPEGTPAVLRDGSEVLIRQVRGSDAPLLADGFARLSARSDRDDCLRQGLPPAGPSRLPRPRPPGRRSTGSQSRRRRPGQH